MTSALWVVVGIHTRHDAIGVTLTAGGHILESFTAPVAGPRLQDAAASAAQAVHTARLMLADHADDITQQAHTAGAGVPQPVWAVTIPDPSPPTSRAARRVGGRVNVQRARLMRTVALGAVLAPLAGEHVVEVPDTDARAEEIQIPAVLYGAHPDEWLMWGRARRGTERRWQRAAYVTAALAHSCWAVQGRVPAPARAQDYRLPGKPASTGNTGLRVPTQPAAPASTATLPVTRPAPAAPAAAVTAPAVPAVPTGLTEPTSPAESAAPVACTMGHPVHPDPDGRIPRRCPTCQMSVPRA